LGQGVDIKEKGVEINLFSVSENWVRRDLGGFIPLSLKSSTQGKNVSTGRIILRGWGGFQGIWELYLQIRGENNTKKINRNLEIRVVKSQKKTKDTRVVI